MSEEKKKQEVRRETTGHKKPQHEERGIKPKPPAPLPPTPPKPDKKSDK